MRQVQEITNVRETASEKSTARKVWENLQYLNLALTVAGQVLVVYYLIGQTIWLVANCIAVARDIALHRPHADLVKDVTMTAITVGLIAVYLLGGF